MRSNAIDRSKFRTAIRTMICPAAVLMILILSLILVRSSVLTAAEKAPKLCIAGGGTWAKSLEISLTNPSAADWKDKIIEIPVRGTIDAPKENALPLAGQLAQSVRFCDADGVEFIFNIIDSEKKDLHRGVIPNDSTLIIPVNCPAKKTVSCKIFFDNPKAWVIPDWLKSQGGITNLDFEEGKDLNVFGWSLDAGDQKSKLSWSSEKPFSGKKCVKCEVAADAEPSWIAARQNNIALVSGAKYQFVAWVRAKDVKGSCGWFLHIGNNEKPMILAPMLYSGTGTYDWKKVEYSFTVPDKCDKITFGTVLRGTGTAWYDAVELKRIGQKSEEFVLKIDSIKKYELTSWYPCADGKNGSSEFKPNLLFKNDRSRYALLKVTGGVSGDQRKTVSLDLNTISSRWGRTLEMGDFEVRGLSNHAVPCQIWNGFVFFKTTVRGNADNYFLIVEKTRSGKSKKVRKINAEVSTSGQAFPGTSMQELDQAASAEQAKPASADTVTEAIPDFIWKANLVKNGNMEDPDFMKTWGYSKSEKGVAYNVVDPANSKLGKQALEMNVDTKAAGQWRGFRQSVSVEPEMNYLCGYAISTDSLSGGYQLHLHHKTADGKFAGGGMGSLGKVVGGKTGWTRQLGIISTSKDTARLELHLTSTASGKVRYDDIFLIPMERTEPVYFSGGRDGCFQIPAIVKVFEESTFEAEHQNLGEKESAFAVMSKNETETIQIAIRSRSKVLYQLGVTEAVERKSGARLSAPKVEAVATVPVDWGTSYYSIRDSRSPLIRRLPTAKRWHRQPPDCGRRGRLRAEPAGPQPG